MLTFWPATSSRRADRISACVFASAVNDLGPQSIGSPAKLAKLERPPPPAATFPILTDRQIDLESANPSQPAKPITTDSRNRIGARCADTPVAASG